MKKYMVLPSNSDLNRGDQALIWNTIDTAKKAGFNGEYWMLANDVKNSTQSQATGIKIATPILKHPSRKFKKNDNSKYDLVLKIKWGSVATIDLLMSLFLLFRPTARIAERMLPGDVKKTMSVLKDCDACFVKGGGFIHSYGKITDLYTIYYSLYHIALAQSLGKPVFVMPNSFGPFISFGVDRMVKKVLNRCKLVTVRESKSSGMLKEIEVKHEQFPDLGFFLEKENRNYIEVEEIRRDYEGYELVGITARPYRFPENNNPEEKYEDYLKSLVEFSKFLYKNKCLPVFVDHTLSEKSHESDRSAINEICSNLSDDQYVILGNHNYNCKDLKGIYSNLDYVVGTRFHSVIFSLAEGIPSLAVTYGGNKGQGIMSDMGLSEYAIDISEISYNELTKKFNLLKNNKKDVANLLNSYTKKGKEEYEKLISRINKIGESL